MGILLKVNYILSVKFPKNPTVFPWKNGKTNPQALTELQGTHIAKIIMKKKGTDLGHPCFLISKLPTTYYEAKVTKTLWYCIQQSHSCVSIQMRFKAGSGRGICTSC